MTDLSRRIAAMMEDLLAWSVTFEAGTITDPLVDPDTSERVAIRVPDAAAVGVLIRRDGPEYVESYAKGDVVATDERLLVVDGDRIMHCWTWATDTGDGATLDSNGYGAMFLPSEARHAEGARHLLAVVPQALLRRRRPKAGLYFPMIAAWSRVIAAYRLSRGELEIWRDEQRRHLIANTGDD